MAQKGKRSGCRWGKSSTTWLFYLCPFGFKDEKNNGALGSATFSNETVSDLVETSLCFSFFFIFNEFFSFFFMTKNLADEEGLSEKPRNA